MSQTITVRLGLRTRKTEKHSLTMFDQIISPCTSKYSTLCNYSDCRSKKQTSTWSCHLSPPHQKGCDTPSVSVAPAPIAHLFHALKGSHVRHGGTHAFKNSHGLQRIGSATNTWGDSMKISHTFCSAILLDMMKYPY